VPEGAAAPFGSPSLSVHPVEQTAHLVEALVTSGIPDPGAACLGLPHKLSPVDHLAAFHFSVPRLSIGWSSSRGSFYRRHVSCQCTKLVREDIFSEIAAWRNDVGR
jgi:hypothetical protein